MFTKDSHDGKVTILAVYVNDIILTRNYKEMIKLKENHAKEFEIKDLGLPRYFLGMEVARSQKGIFVSQCKYTMDLLKEIGMLGSKLANTPMDSLCKVGVR